MLATLFLRQHYLLDVISAIVLVCVAYWGVKYAPWLQRRITDFEIQITRWNINIKLQKSPKHKTVST
jgi:membrane-associated phospholipid phosphatase